MFNNQTSCNIDKNLTNGENTTTVPPESGSWRPKFEEETVQQKVTRGAQIFEVHQTNKRAAGNNRFGGAEAAVDRKNLNRRDLENKVHQRTSN